MSGQTTGSATAQSSTRTKYLEFHELSAVYPMVDGLAWRRDATGKPVIVNGDGSARWQEFVRSIRTTGLINPIVLYEGQILDGRNRYIACLEAGVEPRFVEVSSFVRNWSSLPADKQREKAERVAFDANKKREHYDAMARALITLPFYWRYQEDALPPGPKDPYNFVRISDKQPIDRAADDAGVSRGTITNAVKLVKRFGEEVVEKYVSEEGRAEVRRAMADAIREDGDAAYRARQERERAELERRARGGAHAAQEKIVDGELEAALKAMKRAAEKLGETAMWTGRFDWSEIGQSRTDAMWAAVEAIEKAIDRLPWGEEE